MVYNRRYPVDSGRQICHIQVGNSSANISAWLHFCQLHFSYISAWGLLAPCFIAAMRLPQFDFCLLEHGPRPKSRFSIKNTQAASRAYYTALSCCIFLELNSRTIGYKTHTLTARTSLHLIKFGTNILCISDGKLKVVFSFTILINSFKNRWNRVMEKVVEHYLYGISTKTVKELTHKTFRRSVLYRELMFSDFFTITILIFQRESQTSHKFALL